MNSQSRSSLVLQMFSRLQPGERLTAVKIVEGLLHHGHTFGAVAPTEDTRVELTERTLARLVKSKDLVRGAPVDGRPTWHLPTAGCAETAVPARSAPTSSVSPIEEPVSAGLIATACAAIFVALAMLIYVFATS